jgi:hypothetical protein|tara:strand:+ start:95 stop:301 length:207 start_codon:yes stop_codon:yes gene_type:complete
MNDLILPYGRYLGFVQGRFECMTIADFTLKNLRTKGAALSGENNISILRYNKIKGRINCIQKNLIILN